MNMFSFAQIDPDWCPMIMGYCSYWTWPGNVAAIFDYFCFCTSCTRHTRRVRTVFTALIGAVVAPGVYIHRSVSIVYLPLAGLPLMLQHHHSSIHWRQKKAHWDIELFSEFFRVGNSFCLHSNYCRLCVRDIWRTTSTRRHTANKPNNWWDIFKSCTSHST